MRHWHWSWSGLKGRGSASSSSCKCFSLRWMHGTDNNRSWSDYNSARKTLASRLVVDVKLGIGHWTPLASFHLATTSLREWLSRLCSYCWFVVYDLVAWLRCWSIREPWTPRLTALAPPSQYQSVLCSQRWQRQPWLHLHPCHRSLTLFRSSQQSARSRGAPIRSKCRRISKALAPQLYCFPSLLALRSGH